MRKLNPENLTKKILHSLDYLKYKRLTVKFLIACSTYIYLLYNLIKILSKSQYKRMLPTFKEWLKFDCFKIVINFDKPFYLYL